MANSSIDKGNSAQTPQAELNSGDASKDKYLHTYVIVEHEDGKPLPVSLEMLGEARRLVDNFNDKY